MRFCGTCYRAHDPRWAFSPLSGAGAALHGGRFNPKGVPALYLALTVEGMILEMSHGLAVRFEPLTICTYDVDAADVIDLRDERGRRSHGIELGALACPWVDDVSSGRAPASWRLAEQMIARGAAGVVVPSFAIGARADMSNLVLWSWGPDLPHRVVVHDPSGRLPRDQLSWNL